MKRVTSAKLLRASNALIALLECDGFDEALSDLHVSVEDEYTERMDGWAQPSSQQVPHSRDIRVLAHYLGVMFDERTGRDPDDALPRPFGLF